MYLTYNGRLHWPIGGVVVALYRTSYTRSAKTICDKGREYNYRFLQEMYVREGYSSVSYLQHTNTSFSTNKTLNYDLIKFYYTIFKLPRKIGY